MKTPLSATVGERPAAVEPAVEFGTQELRGEYRLGK